MPDLEVTQKACGARNPARGWTCVARYSHVHHRDADGRQWPNNPAGADTMTTQQATDQLYYWAAQRIEVRDRAFDALIGWVAGRAVTGDPDAAGTLRLIRDRADRT